MLVSFISFILNSYTSTILKAIASRIGRHPVQIELKMDTNQTRFDRVNWIKIIQISSRMLLRYVVNHIFSQWWLNLIGIANSVESCQVSLTA
jgi:hypothetical protein